MSLSRYTTSKVQVGLESFIRIEFQRIYRGESQNQPLYVLVTGCAWRLLAHRLSILLNGLLLLPQVA